MKKCLRLTALMLALVLCFGMTAMASPITDADKATIKDPVTGAMVTFTDTVGEKIEVTYESTSIKEGQFYLVMVVAATEVEQKDAEGNVIKDPETGKAVTETVYSPTKETILYINQTTGVDTGETDANGNKIGKIVFGSENDKTIYPSDIKDSAILIYGSNIDGTANSLIAAIIDAKYIIGDVTGDGKVSSLDALMILQSLVGKATLTDEQKVAGNVDGTGTEPGALDALKILQYLVGKATL